MIAGIANHLWQSTLFAAAAGLLALLVRRNHARVRYWVWFGASAKFLIPFALLTALGTQLQRAPLIDARATTMIAATVAHITEPFSDVSAVTAKLSPPTFVQPWDSGVIAVWAIGMAALVTMRLCLWFRIRRVVRISVPVQVVGMVIPVTVRVRSSAAVFEPSIVGILRPILLLPSGIESFLSPHQFRAIVAHELCHARHRDNLTAAIHMVVEAVFWFHPLVWWIGARLVEAREHACDEDAVREVDDPQMYAEGILNVCKRYVQGSVACVSGISGADLKMRIDAIMANRTDVALTVAKKCVLGSAGLLAFSLPVVLGAISSVSGSVQGVAVIAQRPGDPTPSLAALPAIGNAESGEISRAGPADEQETGSSRDSGVTAPRIAYTELPRYPQAAKDAGIQGTVGLTVVVNANGTAGRVRVTRSLDTTYGLDAAAASAAARWRFEPGRHQGKPVPVEVSLEFRFTLRD